VKSIHECRNQRFSGSIIVNDLFYNIARLLCRACSQELLAPLNKALLTACHGRYFHVRYRRRYSDWSTGRSFRVSNPGRGKRFFYVLKRPHRFWGPPSPLASRFVKICELVQKLKREGGVAVGAGYAHVPLEATPTPYKLNP
jgi:hypothetical protein